MREIDRRTRVSRRLVLRGGAAAVPMALVAGELIAPAAAWAQDAKALAPATLVTLAKMARDIYPHDHISDSFYITAVTPWDGKAAADPATKELLEGGVARLNQDAQDRHGVVYIAVPWEDDRVQLLKGLEQTTFFHKVRADLVVSLYNQQELWPKFGYEGSSAEHGGYIHRGFDDINWLPVT
jgi:hypothetical protein